MAISNRIETVSKFHKHSTYTGLCTLLSFLTNNERECQFLPFFRSQLWLRLLNNLFDRCCRIATRVDRVRVRFLFVTMDRGLHPVYHGVPRCIIRYSCCRGCAHTHTHSYDVIAVITSVAARLYRTIRNIRGSSSVDIILKARHVAVIALAWYKERHVRSGHMHPKMPTGRKSK